MSWHKPENKLEQILNLLLRPLSAFYYLGAAVRLNGYQAGILKQKQLSVPVVSVGNLTVGGTGKTPITIELARSLMQFGLKVGIVSRGYKRQSSDRVLVVSDGRNVLVDAFQAGDEPYLIASSASGAVVIVSADRYEGGKLAVNDYGCDVIILDDGFQHLKLARSYDIVVWDYNDDPRKMGLLPAGRLREPLSELCRADCLVISKVPENPDPERMNDIRIMVNRYKQGMPVLTCRFETDGFHLVYPNQKVRITTRGAGTRVFAFCGIARPEGFFKNLEDLGCVIVGKETFPDHHWYSDSDLKRLIENFKASGAQYLVTTEKDRVRLPEDFIEQVPLAELIQTTSWGCDDLEGEYALVDIPRLRSILRRKRVLARGRA
jgi:tetraacyldisaccharide 4'-kinase